MKVTVEDVPRRLASARSVFKVHAGDRAVKTDKTAFFCDLLLTTMLVAKSPRRKQRTLQIWLEQRNKRNNVLGCVANHRYTT